MVGYVKDITGTFSLAIIVLFIVTEAVPILGLQIRETGKASSKK
jgi:hypothetical protein